MQIQQIERLVYIIQMKEQPTQYLIKKYVKAISAELKKITFDFGSTPKQFSKIELGNDNIIDIYDVRDSNGNKWYNVPYLAQEMVYVDYPTSDITDKDLAQFKEQASNVLKVIKTSRRFTTKVNENNSTSLVFGGGNSTSGDETLIPNFKNVGLGLNNSIDRLGDSFDPSNFLKTKSYGQAPVGEFTVSYLVGGGIESNVGVGELVQIETIEFDEDRNSFTPEERGLYRTTINSVAVDNEEAATGGKGADTIEEIRENALANFGSQNRAGNKKRLSSKSIINAI